ncbi:MAG: 16S rRNA (guanine(966)-N(2))-methyltransferase RsmD [Bacteroidota bacterium]
MRIISGSHRGRRLVTPTNLPVRPTTDMAKEALFNILVNRIDFEVTRVLDLFAGTGNLTFEFASRGCPEVTAVELNFKCIEFIKKTTGVLDFHTIRVMRADAIQFIRHNRKNYELIFADPPYEMEGVDLIPGLIFENKLLSPNGLLILEHDEKVGFRQYPEFLETRNYGKVNFSFFEPKELIS